MITNRNLRVSAVCAFAIGLVAADQVTKWATTTMTCGPLVCPMSNDALMLGIGDGNDGHMVVFGSIGIATFAAWMRVLVERGTVPLGGALTAGAGIVGNAVDRIIYGHVRDFLVVPGGVLINVADVAIVAGLWSCAAASRRSRSTPRADSATARRHDPHRTSTPGWRQPALGRPTHTPARRAGRVWRQEPNRPEARHSAHEREGR